MEYENLPQDVQLKLMEYQSLQQQIQGIITQIRQYEARVAEISDAQDLLSSLPENAPVYKSIGNILSRTKGPKAVSSELTEEKEMLEVRLESLRKQEKEVSERFTKLQEELKKILSASSPAESSPSE